MIQLSSIPRLSCHYPQTVHGGLITSFNFFIFNNSNGIIQRRATLE